MGELAALFAAIGWAVSAVSVQKGVKVITPLEGAFISTSINALIFIPLFFIMVAAGREPWFDFSDVNMVKGAGLFLLAGVFSVLSGKVLSFQSISHIGSNRSTQLRQTEPVFGVIIGVVLLQDHLVVEQWVGILMVMAAVLFITWENGFFQKESDGYGRNAKQGIFMSLAAGLGFAISKAVRKAGLNSYPSALVASALNSLGSIIFLGVLIFLSSQKRLFFKNWGCQRSYIRYFLISGFSSSAANLSMSWALMTSEVSTAVVIASTTPFFTILLNRLFFAREEKINPKLILTGILIISGVFLMSAY